jgi:hypothetical protein
LIENDHRLNQIINIFNLTNCIREPTRLGALLDPILFSDELETRIQFVRLKIFIIWFKRWSFSINKFTFKSPVIIIRGDDSNALSIEMWRFSQKWPPRYSWNIVESGVKHHKPTHKYSNIVMFKSNRPMVSIWSIGGFELSLFRSYTFEPVVFWQRILNYQDIMSLLRTTETALVRESWFTLQITCTFLSINLHLNHQL